MERAAHFTGRAGSKLVCEVIHLGMMAEARVLRCFQNLSQLCSQGLRIPQRVTWHTFSDSKYLHSRCAWPGFLGAQVGRGTGRHWLGLSAQAWVKPPAALLKSKGALSLTPLSARGLGLTENPSCLAAVARIITRSWTVSCTLSAETSVSCLFILGGLTGRKVKIPAPDWHHPWKQRIDFLLREWTTLWAFLETAHETRDISSPPRGH